MVAHAFVIAPRMARKLAITSRSRPPTRAGEEAAHGAEVGLTGVNSTFRSPPSDPQHGRSNGYLCHG